MVNAAQVEAPKQNVSAGAPLPLREKGTGPDFCSQYTWQTFVSKVALCLISGLACLLITDVTGE